MDFNEYQDWTTSTAKYKRTSPLDGINYVVHGLTGEAGEIANKWKKVIRDDGSTLTEEVRLKLVDEASDCLWYLARLATELGVTLSDVAEANQKKLNSRRERGTLQGSGDNR